MKPELRIAAADAIGMIGPQDQDVETLTSLANDPVPDVRRAVSQAVMHGKGACPELTRSADDDDAKSWTHPGDTP